MNGAAWSEDRLQPCGTSAAHRRHLRRGEPPCADCRAAEARSKAERYGYRPGAQSADHREIRNGLPFVPYRYRGTGADAITGEVVVL